MIRLPPTWWPCGSSGWRSANMVLIISRWFRSVSAIGLPSLPGKVEKSTSGSDQRPGLASVIIGVPQWLIGLAQV